MPGLFLFPYSFFKVPRYLCTFFDQLLLRLIDDPEKLRDGYICPALIVQMQDAVQVSLYVLYRDFHFLLVNLLGDGADMDRIFADGLFSPSSPATSSTFFIDTAQYFARMV